MVNRIMSIIFLGSLSNTEGSNAQQLVRELLLLKESSEYQVRLNFLCVDGLGISSSNIQHK